MYKTSPIFPVFISLFLFIVACGEDDLTVLPAEPVSSTQVNFHNLEVGQKSQYQNYRVDYTFAQAGGLEVDSCYYLVATLVLEVMAESGDDFIVKEYLSSQSPDEVGEQLLTIAGSEILVTQTEDPKRYGPTLFNPRLFKTAKIESPLVELKEDCFAEDAAIPFQSSFGVEASIINGRSYENLFGYSYDGGVAADGPYYIHLFSENGNLLRSQINGTFLPFIEGWELVE